MDKVALLTANLNEHREEIGLLKDEIDALKKRRIVAASPPAPKSNSFTLENFVGLKLIHFVGIIILIIGLTIGVKYAIDIKLISATLRIILAYIAGGILFFISLRLRKKYELFSMILFAGAMASIYFTTYAGYTYYAMFPRLAAFIAMLLLTLFTGYNALKYNRSQIAMLGLVGAYGIPFFVRGNSDNILGLFSYMLGINLAVLFLSFKKYWLSLNYLSFFTTWIIYFSCLYLDEAENYYQAAILFALAFFVLFMLSSLGFKLYRKYEIQYSDSLIIILNSLFVYAALLILLNKKAADQHGMVTLAFAVVFSIAAIIFKKVLPQQKFLSNSLFSVGIVALIVYFPLQYDGFSITIIWVIIAIALFITGLYLKMKLFRFAAMFLFAFTIVKLLLVDSNEFSALQKVIAYIFTGVVLLIVSFLYQRFKETIFNDE